MIRVAICLGLALTPVIAEAQTYRTYPNATGSTTYGSDGSTARTYEGRQGATTYVTRPDGSHETCRTYRSRLSTSTSCR